MDDPSTCIDTNLEVTISVQLHNSISHTHTVLPQSVCPIALFSTDMAASSRAVAGKLASGVVAVTGALLGGETVEARAENIPAPSIEQHTPGDACTSPGAEDIGLLDFIFVSAAENGDREEMTLEGAAKGTGQSVSSPPTTAAHVTELLATQGPETDARAECVDLTHKVTRALVVASNSDKALQGSSATEEEEDAFIADVDEVIMRDERALRTMSGAPMSRDEVAVIADLACAAVMDPQLRLAFSKSQTVQRALRQHTSRGGLLHTDSTMAGQKACHSLRSIVLNMNELLATDVLSQHSLPASEAREEGAGQHEEDDLARVMRETVDRAVSGLKSAFEQATAAFLKFARNMRVGGKKKTKRRKQQQTPEKKGEQQKENRNKKESIQMVTKAVMDKVIMIAVIVLAVIVFRRLGVSIK